MKTSIKNKMRPIHPGEILREEYLIPLEMSLNALAHSLHVPATRLHEFVKERCSISADTAMRLARYFGGDAQSWMNLQTNYDLRLVDVEKGKVIEKEVDLPSTAFTSHNQLNGHHESKPREEYPQAGPLRLQSHSAGEVADPGPRNLI